MTFKIKFSEENTTFKAGFGEIQTASTGGYQEGYEQGYKVGKTDGEKIGYQNGLKQGETIGYQTGYDQGAEDGRLAGYEEGKTVGEEIGYEKGHTTGVADGRAAEKSEWWDEYQINGTRTNYAGAFMGTGWNETTLKPKYSIKANTSYMMFAHCGYKGDLDDIFKNRGLTLEFGTSSATQGYIFYNTSITALGTIDISMFTSASYLTSIFNSVNITTIRNLIPPQEAMAATCWNSGLVNLGIGGAITKSFNLSRCGKLTAASVQSVIDNLADLTGQTSQTITFHKNIVLSDEQKAIISDKGWTLVQ